MHLSRRNRTVAPTRAKGWPSKEEFCQQVDFAAELFGLNPDLSEIQELKDAYDQLSDPRRLTMSPMYFLKRLDPNETVTTGPDGELYILEDVLGMRLLKIWSIIRHHKQNISFDLHKIIADGHGLHMFDGNGNKLVTVAGVAINPTRPTDPGNRYEYACALITEFTGVELTWRDHLGRTKTITVSRAGMGKEWTVEIDQLQPTS